MEDPTAGTYKQLTLSNWQDPDPISQKFALRSPIVGMRPMEGNDWARQILAVDLGPQVPEDVRDVFGVARGCLVYGWFFYPLFRLGQEQLYRLGEMAARDRVEQIDGKRPKDFARAIKRLVELGEIDERDKDDWHLLRKARNRSSHPAYATMMPPGVVLATLKGVAHRINRLFVPGR